MRPPDSLGPVRVRLEVRDDRDRSDDPEPAGSVSRQMRAQVIRGSPRFRPGIDGADGLGRTVETFRLEPGDQTRLATDPTLRPTWYEGADGEQRWREQCRDAPVRLWTVCEADGHRPWRFTREVAPGEARTPGGPTAGA
ncbi:hypothetical protein [Streptomyces cinereospinus]|uniref:Uncharacterized protein n=1 Tax=Streptomyces cinereospinus TaxID=285561 RepID=A0ABV5MXN7_9ACTN